MNDYQERETARAEVFARELAAIASELGSDWEVKPWSGDGSAPRWRELSDRTCWRVIWCHQYSAGCSERIEFKASNWAHYVDESGRSYQVYPHDLYPKEVTPTCTAAVGRDAKAVANQIKRLMPEYDRIWSLCAARAEESGAYYAKTRAAIKALCEATGNEYKDDSTYHSYFLRGMEDTQSVKFNSIGAVEISLPAEEMLEVIDMLYRKRTGKRRGAAWYSACPECGCTDVEVGAWVVDNTEEVSGTGEEGASDRAWCPQCEHDGNDGGMDAAHYLVESEERKPFTEEGG